jgi:hypothetical protein
LAAKGHISDIFVRRVTRLFAATCDHDRVYEAVADHNPDAAVIVPPRSSAVPSASAKTAPTQHDRHAREIAKHGRMTWQKSSGYNLRANVEASIGRYKQ